MNNVVSTAASESFLGDLLGEGSLSDGLLSVMPTALELTPLEFAPANRIFGTQRNDLLQGTQENNTILAGGGSDAIVVGSGSNIIFTSDTRNRGRFENDYLRLGVGQDSVVLGDDRGSFYIAGGWQDSVYIEGFELGEDRLVLHGDRTLYTTESTDAGSWLLFGNRGDTAIAFLAGVQDFDIGSDSVSFLPEAKPVAAPGAPDPVESEPSDEDTTDDVVRALNFYLQLGVPEFREVAGGIGDDSLVGGREADQLIGFGGQDYAFGGGGADLFVLGDFGGAYYTQSGWSDSVYIDDFTVGEDQLQLSGSIAQYSTEATETGLWLYAQGDAIAYFNGLQSLDLATAQYRNLAAS